ncbi:MAG: hypothetical protein JSW47_07265, partial [Phycisphaerales bacterium]
NVVLEKVISTLKRVELPARGRGTAVMLTENYRKDLDNTELIVDFVFTEHMSRTDIFEASGGITGSRLFAQAVSDEIEVSVNREGVAADSPRRHFDIGLDFHPDVFMHFQRISLTKRLENALKYAKRGIRTTIELDENGILNIVWRSKVAIGSPNHLYDRKMHMSFDTSKWLLPVLLRSSTEGPDRTTSIVRLEWSLYDSAWYPSRAEYVLQPGNRDHRKVVIESFTPNVKDEQFLMEWLDVPDGLLMFDGRKERWYKSPLRSVEDPEIPLEEIDFVRKLREQQSSAASKMEADDSGKAAKGFYLRDYQVGRLIGPLSLKAGSLLPPLDKKTYIIADPVESELAIRKLLLETTLYESVYLDCAIPDIIGDINRMLKSRLGDKAPPVRIEPLDESKLPLVTMEMSGKEIAYDVLFDMAARARARIFIEDGVVVLSRKKLTELTNLETTTSEMVARREPPSP